MGCCIYGAILLSRIVLAIDRAQQLHAAAASALRFAGLGGNLTLRWPTFVARCRALLTVAVAAELTTFVVLGAHWEHIAKLSEIFADAATASEAGAPICATTDRDPELAVDPADALAP